MFPKALDYFYNDSEIQERVDEDLTSYAYFEAPTNPDLRRHRNGSVETTWISISPSTSSVSKWTVQRT